jgi:translation elongation factor EF-1alpha
VVCCVCVRTHNMTMQVGRAPFETKLKRYTILDAPGKQHMT